MTTTTIDHNAAPGTSRDWRWLTRKSSEEPQIVNRFKTAFGLKRCRLSEAGPGILSQPRRSSSANQAGNPAMDPVGMPIRGAAK